MSETRTKPKRVFSEQARENMRAGAARRMEKPEEHERMRTLSADHRKMTPEYREKLRQAALGREMVSGPGALRWKGDDAHRSSIHAWLRRHHPPTGACEECGCTDKRTHYAFRFHGEKPYTRDRSDYRELCPGCHIRYDAPHRERLRSARG